MGLCISKFGPSIKFSNESLSNINIEILHANGNTERSRNLDIKNLKAKKYLSVPHIDIHNYLQSVNNFNILAWIGVDGFVLKLKLDPHLLLYCDEVKFNNYYFDDGGGHCFVACCYRENAKDTDWVMATNNGKRYHYFTRTNLSDWEISEEVINVKAKHDVETLTKGSENDSSKDRMNDANPDGMLPNKRKIKEQNNGSNTSDSEDEDKGPTKQKRTSPFQSDTSDFEDEDRGHTELELTSPFQSDTSDSKEEHRGPTKLDLPCPFESDISDSEDEDQGSTRLEFTSPFQSNTDSEDEDRGPSRLEFTSPFQSDTSDSEDEHRGPTKLDLRSPFESDTSDSEDEDGGPTKLELTSAFQVMLKRRRMAPSSKWEKELPI